jgi:hypothetical protein
MARDSSQPDAEDLQRQAELQRFTARFIDVITQATGVLERSPRPGVAENALRKTLLYVSSALEIATGAVSEINVLDMFVFVRLCRAVLEKHWIPTLYRQDGAELARAFARSDEEISEIVQRTLGGERHAQLQRIVETWLVDNPDQTRVEGVRLADFADAAGTAAAERSLQVRGIMSSVTTATRAANEAMMLFERGLFLFHRIPFLWRLQARLAAREMLGDSVAQLTEGPDAPVARLMSGARHVARNGAVYAGLLAGAVLLVRSLRAWSARRT